MKNAEVREEMERKAMKDVEWRESERQRKAAFDDLLAAAKAALLVILRHTCKLHGPMVCDACVARKQLQAAIRKAEPEGGG